jgi:DNA-directed RNA polymerase specialized sigma subunit
MATHATGLAQGDAVTTGRQSPNTSAPNDDPFRRIKSFVIRELDETERLILILWHVERMAPAEIAVTLGVSEPRVRSLYDDIVGRISKAA